MTWLVIVLLVFVLLIVVVLCGNIRFRVEFTRVQDNDRLLIHAKALYGILRYRYVLPIVVFKNLREGLLLEVHKEGELPIGSSASQKKSHIDKEKIIRFYKESKELLEHTDHLPVWMRRTAKKVHCTEFKWRTQVGLGDAPETAMTTGVVWSLKSTLLGHVFRFIHLETQPKLDVLPLYHDTRFTTDLNCILKIRLGNAIFAGLQLLVRILKVKGGFRTWQSILFKA